SPHTATIEHMFALDLVDAQSQLRNAVDVLVASESGALDVVALRRQIDRLERIALRALAEADRRGDWQTDGFASTESWLREKCRMDHGEARRSVLTARRLESLPALSQALEAGDISKKHVETVTNVCTSERIDAMTDLDEQLADAARLAKPR